MIEAQRVARFVRAQLVADVGAGGVNTLLGGRIYRDQVPQAAALPAATITIASAVDTNTVGGRHVWQGVLVDVRVVGEGADYGPINAAADRVYTVLQGAGGLQVDAQVVKLRREAVQGFVESESGKSYTHLVQTFRTEAYPAA